MMYVEQMTSRCVFSLCFWLGLSSPTSPNSLHGMSLSTCRSRSSAIATSVMSSEFTFVACKRSRELNCHSQRTIPHFKIQIFAM
uniref:Secreted protein n=1 Tax=Rhipicephalus appendiculatus TaxID=34631 RepID=A0A131YY85_RHIAP